MKLEETIQTCFDNYPELFQTREQVLDHLLCVIGNGYRWINGELISDNDKKPINTLYKGRAKQYKVITKGEHKRNIYDSIINNKDEYNAFIKVVELCGMSLEEAFLSNEPDDDEPKFKENNIYPLCLKYSYLFNYPDNIKPDWLEGIKEMYKYIICNVDKNSDTFREISKAKLMEIYNDKF